MSKLFDVIISNIIELLVSFYKTLVEFKGLKLFHLIVKYQID